MTKVCSVCKIKKDTSLFFIRNRSKNRTHSQCKQCYKEKRVLFMQEHYEKYGDEYRTRARVRKAALKKDRQDLLYGYLEDKACVQCGFKDIRALDFDHIDPKNKEFGIAKAITTGYEWDRILKEIKKCRILCANCHRIRTAVQQNWRKNGALAEK